MAWISVHEQVLGGKLRSLAKEIGCSQNEALGMLVRLWLWGINNADKEGLISWADKDDIAEVLNIGIDKKYDPKDVVDAMVATNWIDIDNGLYIHDWEEWQEQWYKAIQVREKDAARKREERRLKRLAEKEKSENQPEPKKESNEKGMEEILPKPRLTTSSAQAEKGKTQTSPYPKEFEKFWAVYPRKVGKGEAYKKYNARLNDGWSEAELLEAATNYAAKVNREKTESKYIKHAKTFLSDSTPFTDYITEKTEVVSGGTEMTDNDNPYAGWE